MAGSIWDTLGIAPTDDMTQVRRAYARRLKAIDPEADPRGFIALREAYDAARMSRPVSERAEAPPVDFANPPDPSLHVAGWRTTDRAALRRLMEEIAAILRAPREADGDDRLADRTLRLLAGVQYDAIDGQRDAEEWLAATILKAMPRSDAMIRPVLAQFGWLSRGHGEDRPDAASRIIARFRELTFAELNVLCPQGRYHLAYLALQQPPPRRMRDAEFEQLATLGPFFREAGDMPRVANVTFDPAIVASWHVALRRHDLAFQRWRNNRQLGRSDIWIAVLVPLVIVLALIGAAVVSTILQRRSASEEWRSSAGGARS